MKYLLILFLAALISIDPATVRKINQAKAAAEELYNKGDYAGAIEAYRFLIDSLEVREDEVYLNLGNAYYLARDTANAVSAYQSVVRSPEKQIRSTAALQMGLIANQQGRPEEALEHFKASVKANPTNDDARYNYEMVKKKLEEKKKQEEEKNQQNEQDQQNSEQNEQQEENKQDEKQSEQDQQESADEEQQENNEQEQGEQQKKQEQEEQQKKEQDQQEQQDGEEQSELRNIDREKLEQMKISEEKARMILEAMKNQEKQYLQQQRRKPTQPRDRSKPDW